MLLPYPQPCIRLRWVNRGTDRHRPGAGWTRLPANSQDPTRTFNSVSHRSPSETAAIPHTGQSTPAGDKLIQLLRWSSLTNSAGRRWSSYPCSPGVMSADTQEQEDELLALHSIFGSEEFVRDESRAAGEIRVSAELPANFTVTLKEGK